MSNNLRQSVESILQDTDVQINGSRPWDIKVKDERFYARVLAHGTLGFGESYMDGWWECDRIDELVSRLLRSDVRSKLKPNFTLVKNAILARALNLQSGRRAFKIGEAHYDIGNDLYRAMLDRRMVYTCGYWINSSDLNQAQEAKLDLVCRKIGLKPGQKVLDIGCGWGSFAKFASEKYGVQVVGITVSKEQVKLAQESCAGLPIEIRLQDYRDVNEKFDHIVSLGMFEHVGVKNYRTYFEVVQRCLKDDGLFLLHTIGGNRSGNTTDPWIGKYIFPNSMLPSAQQIAKASEGLFVMEDWHNFSTDYDKTLMSWFNNFDSHWDELKTKYNERFYRMWKFYLLACAGTFRARQNQLWQIVYSKDGLKNGYASVR
ncbi:MAG: cyclopropane fatty acyl phospholipid synthase [Patescibacteria group bacterium]|jgi:cyclopropane-fatty-acyl-phospholipid synthase